MALQKDFDSGKFGLKIKDAYIKIRHVQGNKDNWVASIEIYANKKMADECAITNVGFLEVYNLRIPNIDLEKNIYKQIYNYLKTLDQFKDCIDN